MPTLTQNAKSKKWGAKREKSEVKSPAIHFSFFVFCDRFLVFCAKCLTRLIARGKTILRRSFQSLIVFTKNQTNSFVPLRKGPNSAGIQTLSSFLDSHQSSPIQSPNYGFVWFNFLANKTQKWNGFLWESW